MKRNLRSALETQITSSYQYTYTLMSNFDNVNTDEINYSLGLTESETEDSTSSDTEGDISSIDSKGNGQVTFKEAEATGYSMPLDNNHWLYKYMDDRDGLIGE